MDILNDDLAYQVPHVLDRLVELGVVHALGLGFAELPRPCLGLLGQLALCHVPGELQEVLLLGLELL